jgi:hypothetical protein
VRLFWVAVTVLLLGGTAFGVGSLVNIYFQTSWIPWACLIIGGLFGILLHGIPEDVIIVEEEADGN